MSTDPRSRGRNVLFRLFILGQLSNDLLGQAMARLNLNSNDFAVASAIRAFQPITPTRLAAMLGMPPTTLSSYLRRFEAPPPIRRHPNPEDGRSAAPEGTKAGGRNVVAALPAPPGATPPVPERRPTPPP